MTSNPDILVAEDDPTNLFVITTLLEIHGCVIVAATDGEQAVRMALESPPKLILMDISMPKMDGIEAALKIRSDMPSKRVPIVAVTANATDRQRRECEAAGFDGFVTKPIDISVLGAVLQKYFS